MDQALSHFRVLDLSQEVAGPFCTKLLADLGADVIKIEAPEVGDSARSRPPFFHDIPDKEGSLLFLYLNANKRSMTVDLRSPKEVEILKSLVRTADVLVENFPPGTLSALGLSYATLEELNPRLILTSLSPFGQEGPYRDWKATDLEVYALSGVMAVSGEEGQPPLKHGGYQAQYCAGLNGAFATLAALWCREETGEGQHVDVSMQECLASTLVMNSTYYSYAGFVQGRKPSVGKSIGSVTPCKDGYVVGHVLQQLWATFVELIGFPELADPKFAIWRGRSRLHGDELDAIVLPRYAEWNKFDLFYEANRRGLLFGVVQTPEDLARCPQLHSREFFISVDHPKTGPLDYPGAPFVMTQTPWAIRRPPPLLGQHTEEILTSEPGTSKEELPSLTRPEVIKLDSHAPMGHNGTQKKKKGVTRQAPLKGLRVLDVTHVFAAPYATGMLGDLGAEVIRVVSPDRVDMMTALGPFPDNEPGKRFWDRVGSLNSVNRSKRGLGLNLKDPRGADIFRRLVKVSDVVVEGFTKDVMKKFGLDYPALKEIKPDIIMVSNTAYGHSGPWSGYGGVAIGLEATSGMAHLSGYQDGPPSKAGDSYTDFLATWTIGYTVLAALHHRRRTGKGQWIDLSMYQVGATTIGEAILDYTANGRVQTRIGNRNPTAAPSGVYPCKGEKRWVALTVMTDENWKTFCTLMGQDQLAHDRRFQTVTDRLSHQDELDSIIGDWTWQFEPDELMNLLQKAGIASGAVLNNKDLFLDPHIKMRRFYEKVQHPPSSGIGTRLYIGRPWKFSEANVEIRKAAPALGEDNDYLLKGLLGLSEADIKKLLEEGVVGTGPAELPPPIPPTPDEHVKLGNAVAFDLNYKDILEEHYPNRKPLSGKFVRHRSEKKLKTN